MPDTRIYEQQESQNRLIQSMLDASMNGIMLVEPLRDSNGIIIDFIIKAANAAVEAQVGFTVESTEILLSKIFPNYKTMGFFDIYVSVLHSGQLQRKELFYKDYRLEAWFDLGVALNDDSLVITFINITESKKYQQRLQQTAVQLQAFIDTAQTGVFLFEPVMSEDGDIIDFRFLMANRALASYVGQQPDAIVGELGSTWFPGYKTNGLFKLYKETCVTGETNRFDFHYDDDNIDVWLDILSTKFEENVLVTFTDYTPVKRLQLQLESSVQELKRSNVYLEEFAYAASHDLQEPLRKIHFFADRLKERHIDSLGPDGAMMLERMEVATDRIRTLINDLLAYSRVSSKHSQFEVVDLYKLVTDILNDLETSIKEKKAEIIIEKLPIVKGDKVQLRQLFQNLLSNALKYSQPGSTPSVHVQSKQVKSKEILLSLTNNASEEYHEIEVIDNGLGFEQENAKKIFQIFQRLHGRSEYPGTGVGLAIVQKVVENHGGYIEAEGELDKGAVFRIFLPVHEE